MKTRAMLTGFVALGLLAGCGTQKKYDLEVRDAHEALDADFPELAGGHLDKADEMAAKHRLSRSDEARLLRAEAHIQTGDLEQAELLAEAVADRNVPGTRPRAQAEEVLAKIAIRRGQFSLAQRRLDEADRGYKAEHDKQRVADLVRLVLGLEAYGQGKTPEARQHWQRIADPQLRASVAMSLKDD